MSLIICSECGKEISDKAHQCIHCGCPIQKEEALYISKKFVYMCMSDTCLSNPFKEFDEYKGNIRSCPDCGNTIEYYETETIDNNTDLVVNRSVENSKENMTNAQFQNTPKCPTCSSTDIKHISATAKVVGAVAFGLFSKTASSQFQCKNCGYKW